MNVALDLLVVVIFISAVYFAVKAGAVKSVIGFVGLIASFFISRMFYINLGQVIYNSFLKDFFQNNMAKQLGDILNIKGLAPEVATQANLPALLDEKPALFMDLLNKYGVSVNEIRDGLASTVAKSAESINKMIMDLIVEKVATNTSNVIAFIILFVVSLALFGILGYLLGLIFKLPVLNKVNALGGLIVGIIKGLIICIIIASAITTASPYIIIDSKQVISRQNIEDTLIFNRLNVFNNKEDK